jgi:hypothetical protein
VRRGGVELVGEQLERVGIPTTGSLRVWVHPGTSTADVERLLAVLPGIVERLRTNAGAGGPVTIRTWRRAELAVRGRRGAGAVAAGALPVWLASRLAVALTSVAAARLVGGQAADQLPTFRALWDRWDAATASKVGLA